MYAKRIHQQSGETFTSVCIKRKASTLGTPFKYTLVVQGLFYQKKQTSVAAEVNAVTWVRIRHNFQSRLFKLNH